MRSNHGVNAAATALRHDGAFGKSRAKRFTARKLSLYSIGLSVVAWIWFWIRQGRLGEFVTSSMNAVAAIDVTAWAKKQSEANALQGNSNKIVLTAYLEQVDTVWMYQKPLSPRKTSAKKLNAVTFPRVSCFRDRVENFPIDDFPTEDPFLPWIHDYFPSQNGLYIQFVAQNKRRCNTGRDHEETMKFWEPQVSLFQPVPIEIIADAESNTSLENKHTETNFVPKYRLGRSPDTATFPETRFICHFHDSRGREATTFSEYSFNYEYITWRKGPKTMMVTKGKETAQYWQSQLLFRCPVPKKFQEYIQKGAHVLSDDRHTWTTQLWMDLVPIRTPARQHEFLFTEKHVGPIHIKKIRIFDTEEAWGSNHVLPPIADSGRWANLPICLLPEVNTTLDKRNRVDYTRNEANAAAAIALRQPVKSFRLVACTWTTASFSRRNFHMNDGAQRLREWIVFHLMVGFDHVFVYDNTQSSPSPLYEIAMEFEGRVTYHSWPSKICNSNLPVDANPGEWSSQFAAESSCRERYGPMTEWMAFFDTDEYLVPMATTNRLNESNSPWHAVLDEIDINQTRVLKMKSSRAKPRYNLMEVLEEQSTCMEGEPIYHNLTMDPCLGPRRNETLLRVYNCDYVKPPRPRHHARAMKQIYRPDFVLSHFVHYSTVSVEVARYYGDLPASGSNISYVRNLHRKGGSFGEVFLDELTQGRLLHAKPVLPQQTVLRSHTCYLNASHDCMLGFPCPDSVEFVEGRKNALSDESGKYCNCWLNNRLETLFIPRLEALLNRRGFP